MNPFKRLIVPVLILMVIMIVGVAGYVILEQIPVLDSIYMVVITLSTVGFREVVPLNADGKILTIVMIVCGVGTMIYALGQIGEIVIEGQIIGFRRRQRMEKKIRDLKDHYIICGFGRVGHQAAEGLKQDGIPYVVLDQKPETAHEMEVAGVPYIVGTINSEETLGKAGIRQAKGLLACADSDADNVFVTLTAKGLNPNIVVIARASSSEAAKTLKKAGADQALSPYLISGRRMSALATRPVSVEFLDTFIRGTGIELGVKEFSIGEKSKLAGKILKDLNIREKTGVTVLAIKRKDGRFNLQPDGTTDIEGGDIIVGLGTEAQLKVLERMI